MGGGECLSICKTQHKWGTGTQAQFLRLCMGLEGQRTAPHVHTHAPLAAARSFFANNPCDLVDNHTKMCWPDLPVNKSPRFTRRLSIQGYFILAAEPSPTPSYLPAGQARFPPMELQASKQPKLDEQVGWLLGTRPRSVTQHGRVTDSPHSSVRPLFRPPGTLRAARVLTL